MKNNRGFTLVELLAVIAIMAFLAVAAVSGYTAMSKNSRKKAYDSKVQEIEDAAVKFAKETNLKNSTTVSVNKLVVQGYLQPDTSTEAGLSQIENPVDHNNMICNLVNIAIKDDTYIAYYVTDKKDCEVAEQELSDMDIQVSERILNGDIIEATSIGINGNVADWTKEDVVLIVDSTEYTDFVSVSYDYDGQTITKPKNTPLESNEYNDADYNKLAIRDVQIMFNSEVTITYNMSDGSFHSRTITVRIDREVPTMRSTVTNDVTMGSTKKVSLYLDDANGSGVAGFYVSKDQTFPVGTPFISDESNKDSIEEGAGSFAGYNSHFYGDQSTYYVKVVDNVGNEYVSEPLVVANFETASKSCKVAAKGQDGTEFGESTTWFNKKLVVTGTTIQPVGTMGAKYFFGTLSTLPGNNSSTEKKLTKFFDGQSNGGILSDSVSINSGSNLKKYYMVIQGLDKDKSIHYCEKEVGVDLQAPSVDITCSGGNCDDYSQSHTMKITIKDDRSGFYSDANSIKVGWSTSNTVPPSDWETITGGVISDYKNASNETIKDGQMVFTTSLNEDASGDKISGDYYLWVLGSSVKDKAQNSPDDTHGDAIKFDNTPPTCTNSGGGTSWTKNNVTIVGTCHDTGSGCKKGTDGTNYTYDANGNVSKVYSGTTNLSNQTPGTVYDKAGNSTTCPTDRTVKIDVTPPTCTSSGGGTSWTRNNVTIVGTCSDTHSGCKKGTDGTNYTYDANGNVSKVYSGTTNLTNQSPGTVYDNAGNSTNCTANRTVKIDVTPPTCTNSGGGTSWSKANVTIVGTCSDAHSGCKKGTNGTNYTYDANGNVSKVYSGNTNVSSQTPGTVYDNAGNSTSCKADRTVKIDVTPPTISSLKYYYRNSVYKDKNGNWNCQLMPNSSCNFSWNDDKKFYYVTNASTCRSAVLSDIKSRACTKTYSNKTLSKTGSINTIDYLWSANNEGAQMYINSVSASDTGGSELKSTTVYIGDYKMGQADSAQTATTAYSLGTEQWVYGDRPGLVFRIVAKDNAGNETTWKVYAVVFGGLDVHVNASGCSGGFCNLNKYVKYPNRKWATGWIDKAYFRTYIINNDNTTVRSHRFWTYYSDGTYKAKNASGTDMCPGQGCQLHGWYKINGTWYWFNTNEVPPGDIPNGGMLYDFPDGDDWPGYLEDWQVCDDSASYYTYGECRGSKSYISCNSSGKCDWW